MAELLSMGDQESSSFRGLRFARAYSAVVTLISALLTIPCFWHRRIEAGDLASHIYNAWLVQLIQQGRAPDLYLVWRWNNILFDLLLSGGARVFGFIVGPKIVVAMSALVFFWGVFSFIAAVNGRPPWLLSPCIAMLAYGYTFHMGFFNYYLSIGLACIGLAVLWTPQKWDWAVGAMLFGLAVLAHPIGALWFACTLVYLILRRKFTGLWGFGIPAVAIGLFAASHYYFARMATFEVDWPDRPFYLFNGLDQFILYSPRYRFISGAILTILITGFVYELLRRAGHRHSGSNWSRPLLLCAELYVVSFCATSLLPQDMRPHLDSAWIGLIVSRLTLISAVFALCAANCVQLPRWILFAGIAVALAFFAMLYRDTGVLNRMESRAEVLAANLPYGTRVIPTFLPDPESRIPFITHILDRACIGRCFAYSNYEPASRQFRVRARPGSAIATASASDAQEMENGDYVVKSADLPMRNIYQCDPADYTVLCIRDLEAGENTGSAQVDRLR